MSTVTMQELELETAELLPSRETLCRPRCGCGHGFIAIEVDVHVSVFAAL
jgi:hypothetical protein